MGVEKLKGDLINGFCQPKTNENNITSVIKCVTRN